MLVPGTHHVHKVMHHLRVGDTTLVLSTTHWHAAWPLLHPTLYIYVALLACGWHYHWPTLWVCIGVTLLMLVAVSLVPLGVTTACLYGSVIVVCAQWKGKVTQVV